MMNLLYKYTYYRISAQSMLLPQPTYKGPQHILYFRDAKTFKEEIAKENHTVWMIEFYTAWNPACVNFAPIFSEISAKYVTRINAVIRFTKNWTEYLCTSNLTVDITWTT